MFGIAIGLRALAFAAALQAAGIPIFLYLFDKDLDRASDRIGALATRTAAIGFLFTLGTAIFEPARLAGEIAGILDASLHTLLLSTDWGTAIALRLLGLGMIAGGGLRPSRFGTLAALIGTTLVIASFAFMGHTATDDGRWLLSVLLIVHLLLLAFWFGALWPLLISLRQESSSLASLLIEQFSRLAFRLVPIVFVAGLAMAAVLLPDLPSLLRPYGLLLLLKIGGFSLLMGLAAANKWRFGPGVRRGDHASLQALRVSVLAEWALIVAVIAITATMTGLFSPDA
jgi:putative copper export protein